MDFRVKGSREKALEWMEGQEIRGVGVLETCKSSPLTSEWFMSRMLLLFCKGKQSTAYCPNASVKGPECLGCRRRKKKSLNQIRKL